MGAENIRIPQMARLWLAPPGTIAPAGPTVVMPTGWRNVGLFRPDSLNWTASPTTEAVNSHQSTYPTRRFQTGDDASLAVDLQEWSGQNFQAVYGGGTITEVTGPPAYYKFTPPAVGARDEVAACIEIVDNLVHFRRIVPRAQQVEGVEQSFNKTQESVLPLRLAVLGSDVGDPWYDFSDDPSWDLTA